MQPTGSKQLNNRQRITGPRETGRSQVEGQGESGSRPVTPQGI